MAQDSDRRREARRLLAFRRGAAPHPADDTPDGRLYAYRQARIDGLLEGIAEYAPLLYSEARELARQHRRLSALATSYAIPLQMRGALGCAADHVYFAVEDLERVTVALAADALEREAFGPGVLPGVLQ